MIRSGNVEFHEGLRALLRPIDDFVPHPRNYNNGDVEGITQSIVINGMYRPIYVKEDTGEILAGNHTWMACKELEATVIPVVEVAAGTDDAAITIMIADNEYARHARPDTGQLVALLDELQETSGLLGSGINDQELAQLKALNDTPFDPDDTGHRSWPTLCFQVHPNVKAAFYALTEQAGGDNERFGLLCRLAGWNGKKP